MPAGSDSSGMAPGIRHDDHGAERPGQLRGNGLHQRSEAGIGEQHPIAGMADDVGDVLGMQARVDGVADRSHPRRGVVDLKMPVAVPRERADPVLVPDPQALQHARKPARTVFDGSPGGAMDNAVVFARDDLAGAVVTRRMGQQRGDQQRLILHQSLHWTSLRLFL